MPSRKQRRRRDKLQRHEWEYVQLDDEGNEVPVEPTELKKKETPTKTKATVRTRGGRPARTVPPPSWQRAVKRAALFAPFIYIFLSLGKHAPPIATRLGISVLYAAVFTPMFFFVDRMAYRTYLRRSGRGDGTT
jgi:hypothetical protein